MPEPLMFSQNDPRGNTVTKTLKQIIAEMEPQHRRDQALIRKCIEGITEYAGQHAKGFPPEKLAELRVFVEGLASYWGLEDSNNYTCGHLIKG